jgi:hypothetical protein
MSELISDAVINRLKAQIEHEKPDTNKESVWYQSDERAFYRMYYDNGAWRVAKYTLFQDRIIE